VLRGGGRDRGSVSHLGISITHFGIVVAFGIVLLIGLTTGLSLKILRFGTLVNLFGGGSGSTTHFNIHLDTVNSLGLGLADLLDGFLVRGLIGSVLVSIVRSLVSLGLLRRKLSWCGVLGIPLSPNQLHARAIDYRRRGSIPLDSESRDSGLLGQHVANNPLKDRLAGRLVLKLWDIVFVADIVTNTDELTTIVGAGKQDDGDAQDLGGRELANSWRIGLEDELVDADRDRSNKEFSKFLIVVGAVSCEFEPRNVLPSQDLKRTW